MTNKWVIPQHIVLDIETMGITISAPILEIAAVRIVNCGIHGEPCHVFIDPVSCEKAGMRAELPTVMWWLQQSDEARQALTDSAQTRLPLEQALQKFTDWLTEPIETDRYEASDLQIWARGPEFDLAMLADAFRRCGMSVPWPYRAAQSLRTLDIIKEGLQLYGFSRPAPKIKHSALGDAMADAEYLRRFLQYIKNTAERW